MTTLDAPEGRTVALITAAAGVGWALMDALRAWLPAVATVATGSKGDGTVASALAVLVLGTFAVGPLVAATLIRVPARIVWLVGVGALLGGRLALAMGDGGAAQLWAGGTAVVGGTIAVVALAGGAVRGDLARAGLLVGAAGSFALQAALGTVDLVWRTSATARLATLGLVAAAALAAARGTRQLDGGATAAAWPWATLGPALAVAAVLGAPSGRTALATTWAPGRVAASGIGLAAGLARGALAAARVGPLVAGPLAAVLLLGGTAVARSATGGAAVAGRAALLLGLAAGLGAGPRGGATTARRRGLVAGGSLVLLGAIALAVDPGRRLRLPVGADTVLLVVAALLAIAAVVGAVRAARHGRETVPVGLVAPALAVAIAAAALATPLALRGDVPPLPPRAAEDLRVVLANVNAGLDPTGRARSRELGAVLAGLDADLVVLTEVDRGGQLSGAVDVLAVHADRTALTPLFGPAGDALRGSAVLTRLPVLEVRRDPLPRGRDPVARTALTVVVTLPDGSPLALIATQLAQDDPRGDARVPQAQALVGMVAALRERGIEVVLAGDLGAAPGDPALAVLETVLTRALPDAVRTFPALAPRLQLDHVLVAGDWRVVRARAINTGLTDHRVVEVVLARGAPSTD